MEAESHASRLNLFRCALAALQMISFPYARGVYFAEKNYVHIAEEAGMRSLVCLPHAYARIHQCESDPSLWRVVGCGSTLIAALGHDMGHKGLNNAYLVKTRHQLAMVGRGDRNGFDGGECEPKG